MNGDQTLLLMRADNHQHQVTLEGREVSAAVLKMSNHVTPNGSGRRLHKGSIRGFDDINDADDEDEEHRLNNSNHVLDASLRRCTSLKQRRDKMALVDISNEVDNLDKELKKSMEQLKQSHTDVASVASSYSRRRLTPALMRKAQSNDVDLGYQRHIKRQRDRLKMVRIEPGLYLGNMEAATDLSLLSSKHITHVLSLDSVPPPKKIDAILPHIQHLHLQLTDLEDEDLLSCLPSALSFIESALDSSNNPQVLVHCFRGKSRSASVVIAHLMRRHRLGLDRALRRVREKRPLANPHEGFLNQLRMFERMHCQLDEQNVQFRMFRLVLAGTRMRKAKILFRDTLDNIMDEDPINTLNRDTNDSTHMICCKNCKRVLANSSSLMPHLRDCSPNWQDTIWNLDRRELSANLASSSVCRGSMFVNPLGWMQAAIKQHLSGSLICPQCKTQIGNFSWIIGINCEACKAQIMPAFRLEVTSVVCLSEDKQLSNENERKPVFV